MNLGENIHRLRTSRNMSQDALAEALEVSRQSVSKWENNMAVPDLDKLIKLTRLFGITLDELVDSSTPNPAAPEEPQAVPSPASASPVSGMTPANYLGGILLICAVLIAILFVRDYGVFALVLCSPVAVCGGLCLLLKHPALPCGWVCCAGYWIYFLMISRRWEDLPFLILLGVAIVIFMLVKTVQMQRRGVISLPFWFRIVGIIVLLLLGILLFLNTVPPFWITSSTHTVN